MSYGVAATVYFRIYGEDEGGEAKSQKDARELAEHCLQSFIDDGIGSEVGGLVRYDIHVAVPPLDKWETE